MFEDGESTHVENQIASISTRKTHIVPSVNTQLTIKDEIPSEYKLDMSPFVKRTFWLGTASWTENNAQYSLLTLPVTNLPADVILSNRSLYQAVKVGSLMKPSLKIHVSLNGTLTHAGCLLVAILPPGISQSSGSINIGNNFVNLVNTMLSGPHVRLFANEATSAILDVPWYCNTDMCEAFIENLTGVAPASEAMGNVPLLLHSDFSSKSRGAGCYATIAALVLNPLRPGGGSLPLTLILEAVFDEFELAVPTPRFISDNEWTPQSSSFSKQVTTGLLDLAQFGGKFFYPYYGDAIDKVRGLIKHFTGLHNPNIPSIEQRVINTEFNHHNATDIPQFFERLDPINNFNRIYKEPMFGSKIDEMSLKFICAKKQYIGTFTVSTDMPTGQLLFSRPISPNQGGSLGQQPYYAVGDADKQIRVHANNIELMHALHRYWRGGLDVEIEAVMNNKSHLKLKIIKYYNPSQRIFSDVPTMQSLSNAPSQLVEFSAGAQKYCVDLPYLHRNELMPCCEDYTSEGLMHGVYLIYLAQPLIIGDGSPTTVSFNVYMSGSLDEHHGLQFYGYINKNIKMASLVPNSQNVSELDQFVAQSWEPQSSQSCMPSVKPMNEPQNPEQTIVDEFSEGVVEHPNHFNRLVPNYDIRPLIRRMYKVYQSQEINLNGVQTLTQEIALSNIIAESYATPGAYGPNISPLNNIGLLAGMYYGKASTGFKINLEFQFFNNLQIYTVGEVDVQAFYVPPAVSSVIPDFNAPVAYTRNFPNLSRFNGLQGAFNSPDVPRSLNVKRLNGNKFKTEFFIPDVSSFKFIGSPAKFFKFPHPLNYPSATSDLGSIVIRIRNYEQPNQIEVEHPRIAYSVNVGLSDETRFGFHSIAPIFVAKTGSQSTYKAFDGPDEFHPIALLPSSMYKSHPGSL